QLRSADSEFAGSPQDPRVAGAPRRELETREKGPHTLDRALEILLRVGVREPQVVLANLPERRAGEHGDPGLVEQPARELLRAQRHLANVRERVERPTRPPAGDARQRVETVDDHFAALPKLLDHRPR